MAQPSTPILNARQVRFLKSHEVCRFATVSTEKNRDVCIPHVTPVVYLLDEREDAIVVVVDYGTKKLANLRKNPSVSLVVDDYGPSNRAIMITGKCIILERGKEYLDLLKMLFDRFEFYQKNPWGEDESPILKIVPTKAVSWGL